MSNVTTIITKKGLHVNRLSTTPFEGELLYTTDTKQIYVGDGITAGGNPIASGTGSGSGTYYAGIGLTLSDDIFSVAFGDQPNSVCAGDDPRLLPLSEREALNGTQGTPSDTNRFVTNEDPRLTDNRTPNIHDINISHNGILAINKGGTGFDSFSAGQLLIGNNLGQLSKNSLIGSGAVTITNGDGQITIHADTGSSYQAGTGLTLTGDTFAVNYGSTNTTACVGNDPRLSDARTPTAHDINTLHTGTLNVLKGGTGQTTFTNGQLLIGNAAGSLSKNTITGAGGITITNGDGVITIDGSGASGTSYQAGTGLTLTGDTFAVNYGTSATTVCVGNDPRLSDARTPTTHNHPASDINSGQLAIARIPTGTSNSTVAIGNDSRFHVHAETGALSNGFGQRFVSTEDPDPAVGVNGDMWLQYD